MIPRVCPTFTRADLRAMLVPAPALIVPFERDLAAHFDLKHAIAFPYGRSAIYATLRALDRRGEIVQPAYNCVVVAHATVLAGGAPVFVDCARDDPNQDADAMLRAVNDRTVAVMPTSIFGMTFDAPALVAALRRRNPRAFILMDCAQAFDARWRGERLLAQGDAAILAFGIGKAMTTLFGGALLTNRDDVAQRVRQDRARTFRAPSRAQRFAQLIYFFAAWLAVTGVGVNAFDFVERSHALQARVFQSRRARASIRLPRDNAVWLTDRQAALGRAQLTRLDAFIARRKEISARYARALSDLRGARVLEWQPGATHTIYSLRLTDPSRRDAILASLRRRGVQGGAVLDYVVPDLECYRARGDVGAFPHARAWAQSVLNLPNHPTLTDAQVDACAAALRDALG